MITRTWMAGTEVGTLLDTGAGVSAVPEELVVGAINRAHARKLDPEDPEYPVIQLERFKEPDLVNGIASGHPRKTFGSVVLKLGLTEPPKSKQDIFKEYKVGAREVQDLRMGQSDWKGLILGARALDTQVKGGLGFRMTDTHYVFETEGVVLPRLEEDMMPRQDDIYSVDAYATRSAPVANVVGLPTRHAARSHRSLFDSDDDEEEDAGEGRGFRIGAMKGGVLEQGDPLKYEGEGLDLEPGDGAWVPVRRKGSDREGREREHEVVLQPEDACTDVAPGMWEPGARRGLVFVANTTEFDQREETSYSWGRS